MPELISSMNDSKWSRLLSALAPLRLAVSYWRFVNDDHDYELSMPQPDEIVECNGRRGIGDYHVLGPFYFRDVETVRWPASYSRDWFRGYKPVIESQPVSALIAAIDQCGRFDYVVNDQGVTLFAYRELTSS